MDINLVYITTGNKEEAKVIGKELVKSRLAACVNIIDHMNSIYLWEGKLQEDEETVLIAKTTSAMVSKLVARVKELHSYECPCVVTLPVSGGNPDFLEWIENEVL
jgi:periplasmic divalent cation tolerance protein